MTTYCVIPDEYRYYGGGDYPRSYWCRGLDTFAVFDDGVKRDMIIYPFFYVPLYCNWCRPSFCNRVNEQGLLTVLTKYPYMDCWAERDKPFVHDGVNPDWPRANLPSGVLRYAPEIYTAVEPFIRIVRIDVQYQPDYFVQYNPFLTFKPANKLDVREFDWQETSYGKRVGGIITAFGAYTPDNEYSYIQSYWPDTYYYWGRSEEMVWYDYARDPVGCPEVTSGYVGMPESMPSMFRNIQDRGTYSSGWDKDACLEAELQWHSDIKTLKVRLRMDETRRRRYWSWCSQSWEWDTWQLIVTGVVEDDFIEGLGTFNEITMQIAGVDAIYGIPDCPPDETPGRIPGQFNPYHPDWAYYDMIIREQTPAVSLGWYSCLSLGLYGSLVDENGATTTFPDAGYYEGELAWERFLTARISGSILYWLTEGAPIEHVISL